MKVAFVGQRGNQRAVNLVADLVRSCREQDVSVIVDGETETELAANVETVPIAEVEAADLVVSVGGDGTFLFAARGAGTTPIMGVNLGEVGFLNAVAPDVAEAAVTEAIEQLRTTGSARTTELLRLRATGPDWTLPPSLNEVVVQGPRRGHGAGADIRIRIDGDSYTAGHADGVIVATPTGSTAYNLSEGGPLVHPDCSDIVVTEMCGEAGMPPLVVPRDRQVTIEIEGADRFVTVSDGRVRETASAPGSVTIEQAEESVRIAGPPLDFFAALEKLN